jgi:uncharacterized protein YbjT (DUF2867 family)
LDPAAIAGHIAKPKEAQLTGNIKKKTVAVVGATGSVGRTVSSKLQSQGHEVRPIARRAGVSLDDAVALNRSFAGVDAAFLMIPFDLQAADLHRREADIGLKLANAVSEAGVRRVVLLSGLSAHLGRNAVGSALGAAMMEERLDGLDIPELVHLRGGFFMENLLQGIGQIAATGTFGWAFAPDRPMPMVAAMDVGMRAAELLVQGSSPGPRVQELQGPRDYTLAEAVRILGAAIGRPEIRYVQLPFAEARKGMISDGLSFSFADAVMKTARSFNEGQVWAKEERTPRNTTETPLERFAQEVFAQAYRAATPACCQEHDELGVKQ